MVEYWRVSPEWAGETAFIVAGGPSAGLEPLNRLEGRRTIAINSSHWAVPFAEFLFFGDHRWFLYQRHHLGKFAGRIVTVSDATVADGLLHLRKVAPPPALSDKRDRLVMERTSLQAAINLAVHLGSPKIILIGADMGPAKDGRTHHHFPHPWRPKPGCWGEQMEQLSAMAEPLAARGVEVVNTSAGSRLQVWPKRPLADYL